jgi:flagellar hook-associated protein 1 FlgK
MQGFNLSSIMSMGSESLGNARVGIDVASNNISNADTDGYSRQIANYKSKMPIEAGRHVFGAGAELSQISRAHDKFLENSIRKEVQLKGGLDTACRELEHVESIFNLDASKSIRERFVQFNNSLRELANRPEESASRIAVSLAGDNLTEAFRSNHENIKSVQSSCSEQIVAKIENLQKTLKEIAELNVQITVFEAGNITPPNDLQDQRDLLVKEVCYSMDANVFTDNHGQVAIRGPDDCILVDGAFSANFRVEGCNEKNQEPLLWVSDISGRNYRNITPYVKKGEVGGLLQVRDGFAQQVRDDLNKLADKYINKFNEIHKQGFGIGTYEHQNGRSFFEKHSGLGTQEPAEGIRVSPTILSDADSIAAAMSPGVSGDNVILNELINIGQMNLFDGGTTTFENFYNKIISYTGNTTYKFNQDNEACETVLKNIETQRESISGVSLDEETTNLLKYQHLFNASSKLITTVNEMFETVLQLKR